MENNKLYVSWYSVEDYINNVVKEYYNRQMRATGVYGIPRGGLILAVLLSHKLDLPLLLAPAKDCIIIDDIADSGRTLIHYTNNDTQFNKYFITTMYYHKRSMVKPDFYSFEKGDRWVVFPWEVEDEQ